MYSKLSDLAKVPSIAKFVATGFAHAKSREMCSPHTYAKATECLFCTIMEYGLQRLAQKFRALTIPIYMYTLAFACMCLVGGVAHLGGTRPAFWARDIAPHHPEFSFPSLSCFMQNVRPTCRVGCRAHLLASWPQIVSLRIYYRANGTLLRRVHGMYGCAQARQPLLMGEVVARCRATTSLKGRGCRAVPRDNLP